jgi:ribosomal protein S7
MADARNIIAKVVAKAWADPAFHKKLKKDPKGVLAEAGLEFPPRAKVVLHENSKTTYHVVVPMKPEGNLDAAALKKEASHPKYCIYDADL